MLSGLQLTVSLSLSLCHAPQHLLGSQTLFSLLSSLLSAPPAPARVPPARSPGALHTEETAATDVPLPGPKAPRVQGESTERSALKGTRDGKITATFVVVYFS